MTKSTRNSYLDVMKFLFSIIIILYHFGFFFKGGYIVVEAFFMISGYFLMKSLKRSQDDLPLGEQTVRFVIHKYKAIVFFLIPSAIIGCIAYIFILPRDTEAVLMQATLMLFEMIPLQTAGYQGFFATGVSWYLSALFLSSMIIFPMAKKLKTNFSLWLAPLIAILGLRIFNRYLQKHRRAKHLDSRYYQQRNRQSHGRTFGRMLPLRAFCPS